MELVHQFQANVQAD
jgi:hypothetical protein